VYAATQSIDEEVGEDEAAAYFLSESWSNSDITMHLCKSVSGAQTQIIRHFSYSATSTVTPSTPVYSRSTQTRREHTDRLSSIALECRPPLLDSTLVGSMLEGKSMIPES
jgi:hypothetical protein